MVCIRIFIFQHLMFDDVRLFCISSSWSMLHVLLSWAKNIYFAIYLLVFPLSVFKGVSCKLQSKLQNNLLKSVFWKNISAHTRTAFSVYTLKDMFAL